MRAAAIDAAGDDTERLVLIEADLRAAHGMILDIPARFAFERDLFRLRAWGALEPDALSASMVAAQEACFGDAMASLDPRFWQEKLHFYLSWSPFYNFPYTVGYLLSALILARAREAGPAWADGYRDLLIETGTGSVEDVARRHLGVNLHDSSAWAPAFSGVAQRVEAFEALAEKLAPGRGAD